MKPTWKSSDRTNMEQFKHNKNNNYNFRTYKICLNI